MTLAKHFKGLLAARVSLLAKYCHCRFSANYIYASSPCPLQFFLGLLECSVAPAFIFICQTWYRRSELPLRSAAWFSQNGFVLIFGGLIAYGLGHAHSDHLYTYQILFLATGLVTVVIGIATFWLLPESPTTARFLSEDERVIAVERLRGNNQGVRGQAYDFSQVMSVFTDVKSYLWFLLMFCISIPAGAVSVFGECKSLSHQVV